MHMVQTFNFNIAEGNKLQNTNERDYKILIRTQHYGNHISRSIRSNSNKVYIK